MGRTTVEGRIVNNVREHVWIWVYWAVMGPILIALLWGWLL